MRMDTNQEMQLTQEDSGPAAYEFEIENDENTEWLRGCEGRLNSRLDPWGVG